MFNCMSNLQVYFLYCYGLIRNCMQKKWLSIYITGYLIYQHNHSCKLGAWLNLDFVHACV